MRGDSNGNALIALLFLYSVYGPFCAKKKKKKKKKKKVEACDGQSLFIFSVMNKRWNEPSMRAGNHDTRFEKNIVLEKRKKHRV